MKKSTRLILGLVVITLLVLLALAIVVFVRAQEPEIASNYRCQIPPSTHWIAMEEPNITIDNPRFASADAYYSVILLVKTQRGENIIAVRDLKRPLKGFMDRVYMGWMRECPLTKYIHSGDIYPLPYTESITGYTILIKSAVEETGWRVYEWAANADPNQRRIIQIPDIVTLRKLGDHPDGKIFWNTFTRANDEFDKSQVGHGMGSL